jgi:hypothetical protein
MEAFDFEYKIVLNIDVTVFSSVSLSRLRTVQIDQSVDNELHLFFCAYLGIV